MLQQLVRIATVSLVLVEACAVAAPPQSVSPESAGSDHPRQQPRSQGFQSFETNQGQWDKGVRFVARSEGMQIRFEENEAVLVTHRPVRRGEAFDAREATIVRLSFAGAKPLASLEGRTQVATANYFLGPDPTRWRRHVPVYDSLVQRELYPGIGVVFYGHGRDIEYDFLVAPGADPSKIALRVDGGELALRGDDLAIVTPQGEIRMRQPVVYQDAAESGERRKVPARYRQRGREIGFELGAYDRTKPLVIDPVISFATFIGGSGAELIDQLAVQPGGGAIVAGSSISIDFPTTAGSLRRELSGAVDAVVSVYSRDGSRLLTSTYFGGPRGATYAGGLATDSSGAIYLAGYSESRSLPVTATAAQRTFAGGTDAFVAKLSPGADSLLYSTYLGGAGADEVASLAVDGAGAAYLFGSTDSVSFPVTAGAFQTARGGARDLFVAKLSGDGSSFAYSTLIGGAADEVAQAIAVDATGNAYGTGSTGSPSFPASIGSFGRTLNGARDAVLFKLDPSGRTMLYSGMFGGAGDETGNAIAVAPDGTAYVAGRTSSAAIVLTANAARRTLGGSEDAFLMRVSADGTQILASTYLGGGLADIAWAGALDSSQQFWVAGTTSSADFGTSADGLQRALRGERDGFLVRWDAVAGTIGYASFLGGNNVDEAYKAVFDSTGILYIVGITNSRDFPAADAIQPELRGLQNGFLVKFDPAPTPPPASMLIRSGAGQTARTGTAIPEPLVVEVRNARGFAPGVEVFFTATNGTVQPASAITDQAGRAQVRATAGTTAGAVRVTAATAGLSPIRFELLATATEPQRSTAVSVNGASYLATAAPEAIAAVFAPVLVSTVVAPAGPLPTTLGGVTATVYDAMGEARPAGIFYVSSGQVNILMPAGTTPGRVAIRLASAGNIVAETAVTVRTLAPGLFSANSDGREAAVGTLTVQRPDGSTVTQPVFQPNATTRRMDPAPLDLGPAGSSAVVTLFGTGFRGRSDLTGVRVRIDGIDCPVTFAGTTGQFPGLDQLNFAVPRELAGRGILAIEASFDGELANRLVLDFGRR